jgi:uroporphyrinogen decarboxylase
MEDRLLRALKCTNQDRPPVWLMRQAGRYLPEYRALRQRYSLWELFHEPELAAIVTRQPLDILGVDAAILFSDILVIAETLGLKVHFPEQGGPKVEPCLSLASEVDALPLLEVREALSYVSKTISLLKKNLNVPLIGFCGGPFTVASYFIEQDHRKGLRKTKEWLYKDPLSFHRLLQKITDASIEYLLMQIENGVDALQIFDSWANELAYEHFLEFSLNYLRKIINVLQKSKTPVILFCRGASLFPKELSSLQPAALSFDWQRQMSDLRKIVPPNIAVQGNFDPDLLKAPPSAIIHTVKNLLRTMSGQPGFIANLGHGVLPDTPVDNVRCFVDTVKEFVPAQISTTKSYA